MKYTSSTKSKNGQRKRPVRIRYSLVCGANLARGVTLRRLRRAGLSPAWQRFSTGVSLDVASRVCDLGRAVRLASLVVVSALLLAGLTGCGGSGSTDPVQTALARSERAGGVRVAFTLGIDLIGGPNSENTITGTGTFDGTAADMTYTIAPGYLNNTSTLLAGHAGTMQARYVETAEGAPVLYSTFAFVGHQLPAGKTWMKLDVGASIALIPSETLVAIGDLVTNPAEIVALLHAASALRAIGPETIDGTPTTHYSVGVTLDTAKQESNAAQVFAQDLVTQGAKNSGQVDVWVGEDGLIRRIELPYDSATNGVETLNTIVLDLSDWGTPVRVVPPPAVFVYDATQDALDGVPFGTPS